MQRHRHIAIGPKIMLIDMRTGTDEWTDDLPGTCCHYTTQRGNDAMRIRTRAEESGALSLEDGANIASIGSSIVGIAEPLVKDIYDHFHKSSRDVLARDAPAAGTDDESGAISLSTIATIASVAAPLVSGLIDHFTNSNNQQRDLASVNELLAREFTSEEMSSILSIGSNVASAVAPIINDVVGHFTKNSRSLNDLD